MKKYLLSLFILLVFFISISSSAPLTGCVGCDEAHWGYSSGAFDHYNFQGNLITPSGIAYDPSGQPINPELIDRLTNEVETCLLDNKYITSKINRQSFNVIVANDWHLGCDEPGWGVNQLLPVLADQEGCSAKGMTPNTSCHCEWRAGIRCPNSIITTPAFYLYKDALIRYTANIINPWADATIASCAQPSTAQLSDGTEP